MVKGSSFHLPSNFLTLVISTEKLERTSLYVLTGIKLVVGSANVPFIKEELVDCPELAIEFAKLREEIRSDKDKQIDLSLYGYKDKSLEMPVTAFLVNNTLLFDLSFIGSIIVLCYMLCIEINSMLKRRKETLTL